MAEVVENAKPCAEKYAAEEVEKKFLVFIHASAEVVLNARPNEVKYDADEVLNEFARYAEPSKPSKVPVQSPMVLAT